MTMLSLASAVSAAADRGGRVLRASRSVVGSAVGSAVGSVVEHIGGSGGPADALTTRSPRRQPGRSGRQARGAANRPAATTSDSVSFITVEIPKLDLEVDSGVAAGLDSPLGPALKSATRPGAASGTSLGTSPGTASHTATASVSLAYKRHGTGEPVLLLHGIGLNLRAWGEIVPLLTAEREVIVVDLPGFGRSQDWPAGTPRNLPTTVALLDAVCTALGVSRPHVVGHSLGGLIALRLGQAGLARSVTALAPAGFWTEAERRYAFAVLTAARRLACTLPPAAIVRLAGTPLGRRALSGTFHADLATCSPKAVTDCVRSLREATGFTATLRAGRASDLFTGAPPPKVPVTLAWGTADRVLPPRQAARAATALPKADLVWLPGCGHVPMNDAPELVAQLILEATSRPRGTVRPRAAARRRTPSAHGSAAS